MNGNGIESIDYKQINYTPMVMSENLKPSWYIMTIWQL